MATTIKPIPAGMWRARPFDETCRDFVAPDPMVIDAIKKVNPKWDGTNWEAVRVPLQRIGLDSATITGLTLLALRMQFAQCQHEMIRLMGGIPDTAVNLSIRIEAVPGGLNLQNYLNQHVALSGGCLEAAQYIDNHPGCKGPEIARAIPVAESTFDTHYSPKLKAAGYTNGGQGIGGWHPPAKPSASKLQTSR